MGTIEQKIDRRGCLYGLLIMGIWLFLYNLPNQLFKKTDIYKLILPDLNWHSSDLERFIEVLNLNQRKALIKSFEIDSALPPEDILEKLVWTSSNVLTYPFRDKSDFDYHAIVKWSAKKLDIDKQHVNTESTFSLEARIARAMLSLFFEKTWDKLNPDQRIELLNKINEQSTITDITGIASLSGAGALATLSTTVYFTGFAFYTTMSTVISTVAGFFSITLPFAAYTGASSVVAFLSGPVGWALFTIMAIIGIAMIGRADVMKTTAFLLQIHMLKIERILAENKEKKFKRYLPA